MSWFDIAGALIGAGGSIIGGQKANKFNLRIAKEQMAAQKEFAQHGVKWRVEDARSVGLHPLYALGAQVPSYQPVSVTDSVGPAMAEAGQNIGRAVAATQSAAQRRANELQLKLLESQIGESDARAAALRSEAFRNLQNQNPPMPDVSTGGGTPQMTSQGVVMPEGQLPTGLHNVKPQDSIIPRNNDPTVGAGINPGWSEFRVAPGFNVLLPTTSSDPAEALESVGESFILQLVTYMENRRRYGQKWTDEFFRRYVPGGDFFLGAGGREFTRRNREAVKRFFNKAGERPSYYPYGK